MARDPDEIQDDIQDVVVEVDREAVIDEAPAEHPLADGQGLGADLPEADTLDQWREVEHGDDEVR